MDSSEDAYKRAKLDEQEKKQACESVDIIEGGKDHDAFDDEEYKRETRTRLITIGISSIILLLLILSAIIGILIPIRAKNSLSSLHGDSIKTVCNTTLYPDSCYSSILSLKMSTTKKTSNTTPMEIFVLSLQVSLNALVGLKSFAFRRQTACEHLIQDAIDHVNMSMSSLQQYDVDDLRTWLSTAITDQDTCLDEFKKISSSFQTDVKVSMENARIFTSNSLAIISKMSTGRKVVPETGWMHRRLLEVKLRAHMTVAKDGSGDYESISEAVKAMPKRSKDRFFIYVKKGEYYENVVVDSDSWNLMIYGDGMNKTIVSSNWNYADGVGTYDSGTLIAEGRGFIAKDMGFKNTAGPQKLQAVAVRSSSDQSIFYRCSFDAYQDTLYTHTNRQFYRECIVTGTIDFIFGNAAVVFQNCSIQPRQPGPGQYNTVTAQSKSDPNQNTGFSIQQCRLGPHGNLTARTFLGRPWNVYSTTVIMESEIQGIIDPAGWISWEPPAEAPDTIFYAEYKNTGPGSVLDGRVMWIGFRPNIAEEEADKFSVDKFIQGTKWLTEANIEYETHI